MQSVFFGADGIIGFIKNAEGASAKRWQRAKGVMSALASE